MARSKLSKSSLLLGLAALALQACPDPEARYEEFVDKTRDERVGEGGGGGGGDGTVADISGFFLLAIDTPLGPGQLLKFGLTIEADLNEDGTCPEEGCPVTVTAVPITIDEPGTGCPGPGEAVGDPIVPAEDVRLLPNGTMEIGWGTVRASGCANPISGANIVTTLRMNAVVLDENAFCGTAVGSVSEPTQGTLRGSTFAAVRVPALEPEHYPAVPASGCDELETGDGGEP